MTKRNREAVKERRQEKKHETGRVIKDKFEREIKPPVTAKTNVQREFLQALAKYDVVVFSAPAGVGKSFITMSEVSDWLKKGIYKKCVLTRPAVGMGNSIGLLKGDMRAKFEMYLLPLVEVIKDRYGEGWYENCLSSGVITMLPMEYARGMSIGDVFVCEEMQNSKPDEMYTLITRLAEGGKLICIGDPNQNDLKGENGIEWLIKFVDNNPELQKHIKVIQANSDDIVRSGLCKSVVKAKERSIENNKRD